MMTWGNEWNTAFDLVVFIRLENEMSLARHRKLNIERYRDGLLNNEKIKENSRLFLEWLINMKIQFIRALT
ncbi:hypothetical protein [Muriicola sp. Z0-33]|uniref:hypothetical protein n=1 Tax=Muriicola sp. Z0-33 TaxID=2816957 RepID=UPI0022388FEB|nr:hypothetical protein [Muriicola sp. Z0-33]MCW5516955.1 hypothetical protein [Muriicola sp. Z0-33]